MDDDQILEQIRPRYSDALISGVKVTRTENTFVGHFRLDADTAWILGADHVGVIVGRFQNLNGMVEAIRGLRMPGSKSRWVLVAAIKKIAAKLIETWFRGGEGRRVAVTTLQLPQVFDNIILATPESLGGIEDCDRGDIAGIIALDPTCAVHTQRRLRARNGFIVENDRPQLLVKFRNDVAIGTWLPPLIILTEQAPLAIETDVARRSYGLESWWYVDATRGFQVGPPPRLAGEATDDAESL